MKILHVAETVKGGVASYLQATLPAQSARWGADQVALLGPSDHADHLPRGDWRLLTYARDGRNLGSLARLAVAFSKHVGELAPEIVFLHCSFAGLVGRLLNLGRARVVYCPHGWAFNMQISTAARTAYGWLECWLARLATTAVVCISQHELDTAREWGLPAGRLHLVRHGLEDVELAGLDSKPAEGPLEILFVGRFDRQKGVDILAQALAGLSPQSYRLRLVGEQVRGDSEVCLPAHCERLGWKEPQELTGLYRQADVLVMPSRWEGFGLVALEAMRCETAVFAARQGGLVELVEDGVTGALFDTADQLGELLAKTERIKLHE
ncbi:MAG: glycosyltransferase family 4 protein, partial [Candidatus Eremiobacteraeota bacterium]|nr:glycosyltransferase family 4 protein [Candidatus Eremiobacteraeota bacterium]